MSVRPYRDIVRRKSRQIRVGSVLVGGDAPIIGSVHDQHADLGRARDHCADANGWKKRVPISFACRARTKIPQGPEVHSGRRTGADCRRYSLPLPARHRSGRGGRRLPAHQPGKYRVEGARTEVVKAAKDHGCSMRIGVNAGSLERDLLGEIWRAVSRGNGGKRTPAHARILEDNDFFEFKISVKASDVFLAVAAYQQLAEVAIIRCTRHHRSRAA